MALPAVATTKTKTSTWPQMWMERRQADRRKCVNMREHQTCRWKRKENTCRMINMQQTCRKPKHAGGTVKLKHAGARTSNMPKETERKHMPDDKHAGSMSEGRCEIVPRLPRTVPRRPARPGRAEARPKRATQCHECHACHTKRWWVARLTRKTLVDVRLCHACHVKRKWMSPSATPATHNAAASRATRARLNRTQARHPVPWVPRLPHKTMVDVRLCHACHAKRWWMWDCATPATQNACGCEIVPRLPREMKVDVTKCHACHLPRTVPRRHARPGRA